MIHGLCKRHRYLISNKTLSGNRTQLQQHFNYKIRGNFSELKKI